MGYATAGTPVRVQTGTNEFWYCPIEFCDFVKADPIGFIYTIPNEPDNLFTWTGLYARQVRMEEEFHLRQFRKEVVNYNSAFRYDCVYSTSLGANPTRVMHPAFADRPIPEGGNENE